MTDSPNNSPDQVQNPGAPDQQQVHPELLARRLAVKNQRDSISQRLERWIAFVATPQFEEADLFAIQSRIERGTNLWKQMEEIQLDHVAIADPAEVGAFGNEFMDLEERYYTAKARLVRRSKELEAMDPPEPNGANGGAGAILNTENIRLTIAPQQSNIPNTWGYFDGTLLKWKAFKERFEAAVHKNDDIKPPYKFSYLINSLKGKAADSIKGFTANEANYEAAWKKILFDYNRDYPLARAYLRQFLSLKAISDPPTAEELKHIANVTNETLCNLDGLDYPVKDWDIIVVHVLHGLLDTKLAYEWNLELINDHGDKPTAANMIAFLEKHAAAATSMPESRQLTITVNTKENTNQSEHRSRGAISKQSGSRTSSRASAHGSSYGSNYGHVTDNWN